MATRRAKVVKFGDYRGLKMVGSVAVPPLDSWRHIKEISWLTAQVESNGLFGTVMNYDGTGMTAGIHQAIAVYPRALKDNSRKNDQGPLWELLSFLRGVGVTQEIEAHLEENGLYISPDGKCRYLSDSQGKLVSGRVIREMFTGDESGMMPLNGAGRRDCSRWIREFHEAFSNSAGFGVQIDYGERHMEILANRKLKFCDYPDIAEKSILEVFYDGVPLSAVEGLPEHYSLAMSMFWSHSINAPGYAIKRLCKKVLNVCPEEVLGKTEKASRAIIRALGDTPFARWDDDLENGRYRRTRVAAKRHWSLDLFRDNGVMPVDL